ncbi:MAG: Complex III assembly protein translocase and chaperone [Paramarteilia canceri]
MSPDAGMLDQIFSSNQFFTGGAGLLFLGLMARVGQNSMRLGMILIRKRFLTSLEVTNQVERQRITAQAGHYGEPFENIRLSTFGKCSGFFNEILNDCFQIGKNEMNSGVTKFYTPRGPDWIQMSTVKSQRKLNSIFLADGSKKSIIGDVQEFLNNQNWYKDRGIPYKRGYLFYGPPGSGKTSTIMAIAGELNLDIGIVNLNEPGLGDERLFHLLDSAPMNSILLIEDIDRAFEASKSQKYADEKYVGMTHLTMSGLLNALDGIGSAHGMMVFLTTNHMEKYSLHCLIYFTQD